MSRDLPEKGGGLEYIWEKSSQIERTASANALRHLACSRTSKKAGTAGSEQLQGEMVREAMGTNFKGPTGLEDVWL